MVRKRVLVASMEEAKQALIAIFDLAFKNVDVIQFQSQCAALDDDLMNKVVGDTLILRMAIHRTCR